MKRLQSKPNEVKSFITNSKIKMQVIGKLMLFRNPFWKLYLEEAEMVNYSELIKS